MVLPLIAGAVIKAVLPSLIQGAVGQLQQNRQQAQEGFADAVKSITTR